MKNIVLETKCQIKEILNDTIKKCIESKHISGEFNQNYLVEIPTDKSNGDFASNIALVNTKNFKLSPMQICEIIEKSIDLTGSHIKNVEIKKPGFINFNLDKNWFSEVVKTILEEKSDYGRNNYGKGKKIMVEFVSANPTGIMHLGNARGGALGDCLASVLELSGYDVTREFYINDAGNQIEKFGESIYARYVQILKGEDSYEFPEDGYHGNDIKDLANDYINLHKDELLNIDEAKAIEKLITFSLKKNIQKLKDDLLKYKIEFDVWFSEKTLHDDNSIKETVKKLKDRGHTYENEGAVWYKSSEFGSEKDDVLIRKNGVPSYFAADIAYHYNKFVTRKFDKVINIWGADHHGHVARLKGSMDAIGLDGNKLDIVLMQLVRLSRNGEAVKMSKRTGKSITLYDLLEEIPVDAVRFFFNLREPNVHLEFDLDLAVSKSSKNPIYYIQYANARICSIIKILKAEGINTEVFDYDNLDLLKEKEEIELIRVLATYPEEVLSASISLDPSRINRYLIEVATFFHKFYNSCNIKDQDEKLANARLSLCIATKTVINNILKAFKISTPEKM